jgi:hypothetical protein
MVRIIFDWPFANRFIVTHIISGEMAILLFDFCLRQLNSHLASVLSWQAGEISAVIYFVILIKVSNGSPE